ncbi:hypothetical protein D3C80_1932900 [compost metagenome]
MLAVQAWCAAIAREIASTATHRLLAPAAKITPMMVVANNSIDSSRALTGAMPRPIRNDERMPPPTLPKSALR